VSVEYAMFTDCNPRREPANRPAVLADGSHATQVSLRDVTH